jgi:hypothetical protein
MGEKAVKQWSSKGLARVNRHTGYVEFPFPDGAAAEMDDYLIALGYDLRAAGIERVGDSEVLTIEAVPGKRTRAQP